MDRTERFYRIDRLLHERRVVPLAALLAELGVSRATFKRDLEYLRDRLHAPIVWDREAGGYRFDSAPAGGPAYELPGLWFSASELHALLVTQQLLADTQPGLLAPHVAPLQARLAALIEQGGHPAAQVTERVRILRMAARRVEPEHFATVARAVMERRRLQIDAWNRGRDELNTRTVSPQRLVHYRDNWYLDAWCHWRRALRSFALDTLRGARLLAEPARELPPRTLDRHYTSAYGIFSGTARATAVLRFTPERARWVRHEQWHPRQRGEALPDGGWRLRLPYADPRELVMDILRHGRQVVVESPASLRRLVAAEARAVAAQYPD